MLIAWKRRIAPGASGLILFMLAEAVWAATYAVRWMVAEPAAEHFWLDATYFGVAFNATFMLVFTLQFTGRSRLLTRRNLGRPRDDQPVNYLQYCMTTDMMEEEIIFGGEKKLAAAIREAYRIFKPKAISVYSTCPVGLIGDDIHTVCRQAKAELGINVFGFSCEGYKGVSQSAGHHIANNQLFKHVIGRDDTVGPGKYRINVLGEYNIGGDAFVIEDLLERCGITLVSTFSGNSSVGAFENSHTADLNCVTCHRSINYVADMLQKRYGIPWIKVNFISAESSAKSLRRMARHEARPLRRRERRLCGPYHEARGLGPQPITGRGVDPDAGRLVEAGRQEPGLGLESVHDRLERGPRDGLLDAVLRAARLAARRAHVGQRQERDLVLWKARPAQREHGVEVPVHGARPARLVRRGARGVRVGVVDADLAAGLLAARLVAVLGELERHVADPEHGRRLRRAEHVARAPERERAAHAHRGGDVVLVDRDAREPSGRAPGHEAEHDVDHGLDGRPAAPEPPARHRGARVERNHAPGHLVRLALEPVVCGLAPAGEPARSPAVLGRRVAVYPRAVSRLAHHRLPTAARAVPVTPRPTRGSCRLCTRGPCARPRPLRVRT
ncbi:MAG: nitrogenase component 1, partial [Pseudanabaena sp. ELA748]